MSVSQSTQPDSPPKLGCALRQRHMTMIALGGIIGAGLFVGSSAMLSTAGRPHAFRICVAGIVVRWSCGCSAKWRSRCPA